MRTTWRLGCAVLVLVACGDDGGNRNVPVDAPVEPDASPAAAMFEIDRPALALGTVTLGETSPPMTITVANVGETPTGVPAIAVTGPFARGATTCEVALAAGASCTIEVTFTPTVAGAATGELTITADPGGSASLALAGDGIGTGELTISSDISDLGEGVVEETGPAVATFTVTNTGASVTPALTVTPAGTSPGAFVTANDTCSGATLAPAATCAFEVRLQAPSLGPQSALFQVSAAGLATVEGAVTGTGTPRLEVIALGGGAVVSPADFGEAVVNNTIPEDLVITVQNHGSTAETFGVTVPSQFGVAANPCGTLIAAESTCDVTIRFAPTTLGVKTGTVVFDIGPADFERASQDVTGTGIEALSLVALQGANFGVVATNTTATRQFRVTNAPGSVPTGSLAVLFTGPAPLSITADACSGQTLAGGASCLIDLSFSPLTTGPVTGTLTVTGAPGGMPTLGISATGGTPVGAAPTAITLTPSTIAENQPANTIVGALGAVDADPGDSFSFTIVAGAGGADNALFAVTGSTLRALAAFDAEARTTYSIRVQVIDSGGNVFESPVAITVTNVDEPPVAVADARTVLEDSGATALTLLANDTDLDGGPRTVAAVTQPARGTAAILGGGGDVTFAPTANSNGMDSFTYTLNGGSTALVTLSVTAVNDVPSFTAGPTVTVAEDAGAQSQAWATAISAGPANESAQTLQFLVSVDQPALFSTQPAIGSTGTLTFTGAPDANGTATVSVRLQDSGGTSNGGVDTSAVQNFSIVITPGNDAPVITSSAPTMATEDTAYTYRAASSDPDGPSVVWAIAAGNTCTGATIGATTGVYTFTPTGPTPPASCVVAIRVCDGAASPLCSAIQTRTVAITPVNDAPAITSALTGTAVEDMAFTLGASASDPDGSGLTWSLGATHTCGGSVVAATGVFTFTPAGPNPPASCVLALRVCDSGNACGAASGTIAITGVNDAPVITSVPPSPAIEDTLYTYNAVVNDPDGPTRVWSTLTGDTCGGSIGASTGVYTFTETGPIPPTACTVAIQVCDGATPSLCATRSTQILITPVNDAPVFSNTPAMMATEDVLYRHGAAATDGDGPTPITWSLGAGHTCGGSISSTGGGVTFLIAGPVPPATCTLVIRACDGAATPACRNQTTTITIAAVNDAPVITSQVPGTGNVNQQYVYQAVRSDPDGPTQTWSLTASHTCGGSITAAGGRFTWTPTQSGPCNVSVQVCDGGSPNQCVTQTQGIRII